jgi:cytochrome c biogenesis protein CcdA
VVAAVAFFVAAGRRRRDELWGAEREGSLGSAAIVFAVGFAVATVGMILLAWQGPSSRNEAEQWLEVIAELLLALAAACGAIGFFVSRREVRAAPRS